MLKKSLLTKDIILALVLKVILIGGLWFFCFSKAPNPQMAPISLGHHLFNVETNR